MDRRTFVACVAGLALAAAPAALAGTHANIFENVSKSYRELDPSTAAAGMAGASGAVFWDEGANAWANPALLAGATGAHYEYLASRFMDLYHQRAQQLTLGGGGLGVSSVGQPFHGFGKLERESEPLNSTTAYEPYPTGTSTYLERTRSWGVGASVAQLTATIATLRGAEPPAWARHGDVAFGYSEKVLSVNVAAPGEPPLHATARDIGLLVRTGTTTSRSILFAPHVRLDAAWGWSRKNGGGGHGRLAPLTTYGRHAFAARAAMAMPERVAAGAPAWLAPTLGPLLSLGLACDLVHQTGVDQPSWHSDLHAYGAELTVTRVLALRYGHFESATHYTGDTWGCAVTLPWRDIAGVRWAHASVPLPEWLDEPAQRYDTWSVWFDPVAAARARH